ncbi:class Ib ribonucleoside-diphosphate reductase assembly flavoprotein NrdI [Paenibacillus glycinis]|uniref:Class Ib ribonucleoside-diphosphate reductase assembly flavoprotein NrdI n=1 Tax=Paenibacillus glycinis TaxID=2697035 RepID=A0ABW9XUK6_9BACL|nr:class Ib ribonucleoside-diphosphate reductase assembly flavoprotein NrdI [Paenibacillus glycinis]NBD26360.1 class Ib ribonucleoside-diphosphate reductase assembly flavoprotein NrdI [Paenibacillus glycinis]
MLIAYDSRTGNVKRFIQKIDLPSVQIEDSTVLEDPFVLVTYTTGFGSPPAKVLSFLQKNHRNMLGVSASGNRNWGDGFAKSADHIARLYGVPVLSKFELAGTGRDVENFLREVKTIAAY